MAGLNLFQDLKELARELIKRPTHSDTVQEGIARQAKLDKLIAEEESAAVFNPFGRLVSAHNLKSEEAREDLSPEERLEQTLRAIEVIAFVGPSGTGKSTRALRIAREENIFDIIDDGILIRGSRIVAGASAKKAETKLESVRQALFAEPVRAEIMRRALYASAPEKLLILGTSYEMIERICKNLGLEQPKRFILIEDVTTEDERMKAKSVRLLEGKHTIPVPAMEIRHEFSGYLSDPILRLKRRFDRTSREQQMALADERSVVRPTFSALGTYSISDQAMAQMLDIELRQVPGVWQLLHLQLDKEPYGVFLYIDLAIIYGYNAQEVLRQAQQAATDCLEKYTAVNVLATNVRALRLHKLETLDELGIPARGEELRQSDR